MSRIVLIGCGKVKQDGEHAAAELYTGPLFADRRAYADASGHPWWIISAGRGLLAPHDVVRSYDVTMRDLAPVDRAACVLAWVSTLLDELADATNPREVLVELHAGADYAEPLRAVLRGLGFHVEWPVEGLGIGEQRAWYGHATPLVACGQPPPRAERRAAATEGA